jgi:tetratricopeptide (TPR) repeat protein
MNIKKTFILTLFLISSVLCFAQKDAKKGGVSDKELIGEGVFTEGMKFYIAQNYDKAIPYFKSVIEKAKDNAGSHFMLSKSYLALDKLDLALDNAQNAYEINPSNAYYVKNYGELLVKLHRNKEAIEIWKKVIKLQPKEIDNYLQLADTYLAQDKFNDAIETYNEVEKIIGIDEEITRQKQSIYLKQNKVSEALKEGSKLIDSEPLSPELLIPQVQVMLENNKLNDAQELVENALKKNPNFGDGYLLLAEIYRKKGDLEKCGVQLVKAINNASLSVDLKYKSLQNYKELISQQTVNSARKKDLLAMVEQFVGQYSDYAKGLSFLGTLYAQNQDDLKARDLFLKSLQYDKSIYEVWIAVIEIDAKLNLIDDLIAHSEKAIDYFPSQAYFWYHNAYGHMIKKNTDEAISGFEEALNLAANNLELKVAINTLLGDLYNDKKLYKKSEAAYDEALAIEPLNEHVLNNYSYFLSLRKQNLPKAKDLAKKLAENFPNNPTYLDTFAWALFQSQEFELAKVQIDKALASKETLSGTIIEHYGDILFKLNNVNDAIAQWKKAKELGNVSKLIDKKISDGQFYE